MFVSPQDAVPYTPTSDSLDSVSIFSLSLSSTGSTSTKTPASTQQRQPAAYNEDQQPYLRVTRPPASANGTLPARVQPQKSQPRQPVPVPVNQNGSQQITSGVFSNSVFWKLATEAVEREKEAAQAQAAEARAAATATADRSQFLMRQFGALKAREAAAKEAVKLANAKVTAAAGQMEKMKQTQAEVRGTKRGRIIIVRNFRVCFSSVQLLSPHGCFTMHPYWPSELLSYHPVCFPTLYRFTPSFSHHALSSLQEVAELRATVAELKGQVNRCAFVDKSPSTMGLACRTY